mmetsp:Transcript_19019/g.62156  ORF Transcript_19019/g.62156 Transcript_19019/m.62156 type:complete len:225 (-) Transcript_19019:646-1320(-)
MRAYGNGSRQMTPQELQILGDMCAVNPGGGRGHGKMWGCWPLLQADAQHPVLQAQESPSTCLTIFSHALGDTMAPAKYRAEIGACRVKVTFAADIALLHVVHEFDAVLRRAVRSERKEAAVHDAQHATHVVEVVVRSAIRHDHAAGAIRKDWQQDDRKSPLKQVLGGGDSVTGVGENRPELHTAATWPYFRPRLSESATFAGRPGPARAMRALVVSRLMYISSM